MIFSIISIYIFAHDNLEGDNFQKIIAIAFNSISIISGTGYISENFENWGNYASVLFLLLMFIGGCAGSTTGGLKVFRLQILFKSITLHFKKIIQPHSVLASHFNEKKIPESTYDSVMSFFLFLYLLLQYHHFYSPSVD